MTDLLKTLPLDRICGLRPNLWLSVGNGYNREDVKSLILAQNLGFVGDAITTLPDICLKITKLEASQVLGAFSRQEVLRMLLSEPKILGRMPEMKRMRRQRNFLRRLDHALQQGRMAFAHPEEEAVYEERLDQALGKNPLRSELSALSRAYDAWLEQSKCLDPSLLIRQATAILQQGWPKHLARPQELWSLNVQLLESLEREFWGVFSHWAEVKQIEILQPPRAAPVSKSLWAPSWPERRTEGRPDTWPDIGVDKRKDGRSQKNTQSAHVLSWHRWHTLDDAAEFLAETLSSHAQLKNLKQHAILIPDIPAIRRSLRRALEARGIPLSDPRDPTKLKWEESVKWALLPLELVARNFERDLVISWIRTWMQKGIVPDAILAWVKEINARGIRHGLFSYQGGVLNEVHAKLSAMGSLFSGKKTLQELASSHIEYLKSQIHFKSEYFWLIPFFEALWNEFVADLQRIRVPGEADARAHLLFWLEKLQSRLSEATPPVERLKPRYGVQIFRLQQAPLFPVDKIWIFGLPAQWLEGQGSGGYWFTEREREVLGIEFAVRSKVQIREERLKILKAWCSGANDVVLLDSFYDAQGKERETIQPILKELSLLMGQSFPEIAQEMGAHPRFLKSYDAARPVPPQEVQLPKIASKTIGMVPEVSATMIDRYSRCPFQALAYHRWNVSDLREPDTELWPDVKGNLLHESVRLLMGSLKTDEIPSFTLTAQEALDRVWQSKKPRGLIKSKRVEEYVKTRLGYVLDAFCEKEKIYLERAKTVPISLDQTTFRIEYVDLKMIGKPDRIDQHTDGVFILDYKTSGTVPHGEEMVVEGYRLQLPFYAVAARKQLNQSVLGVQFVELDRKGARKSGIFFNQFNGKDSGCLTTLRSSSKSLINQDPDQVWDALEVELLKEARNYLRGAYPARPKIQKRDKECNRCSLADLCGMKRVASLEKGDEESFLEGLE